MAGMEQFGLLGFAVGLVKTGMEQKADADASAANYNALQREARLTDAAAVDALARGGMQAGFARMKGSATIAKQRLAFATSGVDASVGTPAALAVSTALMSELDAQTATNNAVREAWGHKAVADKARTQADLVMAGYGNRSTARAIGTATDALDAGAGITTAGAKSGFGF